MLRAGDERAFEVMYDRHHRGILAFCRHMLGSAEEAEDAVQHTFIAAHRDLTTSDKPIQLKAWLYTIARNRCLSFLRARKEERALDDVPEPSVEGLSVQVQRRQDLRELLSDLHRLPEDQRAALVLSELGALSHDEIGETLGVRKDKVKALVFQARESLASSRTARETDCRDIQEQLSVLRGGSLRRTTLRRHIEVCPACAAFKAEVHRQRAGMAAILPVVPSLALKETVLAAILGGGGAAGGGGILGGGLLVATGTKALVAKVATVAVVAGGATGGGLVAVDEIAGGGEGNTATAMAGVPAEKRTVEMVGSLRERAQATAAKREADKQSAREQSGTRPASSASTSGSAEVVPGRPKRRSEVRAERRGEAERSAGTRRESRRAGTPIAEKRPGSDAPRNDPPAAAAPPPAPAAPAPAPEPPRQTRGDDDKGDKGGKRKRKGKDKDRDKGNGDGKKGAPRPRIPAQTGPGVDPQPDRGRDGERGHRGDRGRKGGRKRRDKAPPVPTPPQQPAQPQVPQQPAPERDGRDGRDRGRGRGGRDDDGHGGGDKDRENAKKAYAAATGTVGAVAPTP